MQERTISRMLASKLTEWIETIQNEELRRVVKRDLLVSGGSIASMFLGEDVNDFDIYIKNKQTLVKLVKYYTINLSSRLAVLTTENTAGEKYRGSMEIAVNSLKEDQVKIFFKDDNDKGGIKLQEMDAPGMGTFTPSFISPNAISLTDKVQIVTRFTGNSEEIHKTFDFIHATNYFTFEEGLVTNKQALSSLLTKQLKYQGSMYPLTSIIRFKKFVKRGWNISAGEILKIMFQIAEFDLKDPQVLEDQLIGVDVAYFSTLIELLRGVPKDKITSPYLNKVIDKVFNSI